MSGLFLERLEEIKIVDSGGDELAIAADGSISVTLGAVTDLDIRDLVYTSDSVTAHQGGTWNIATLTGITNDVNIADGGNSITVDAVNLDIRDLTSVSDSVASWLSDGSGNAISSSAGALDINIASSDIDIQVDLDLTNIVADDAPDATENPLKIGYRSVDSGSVLGALSASGDKANAISDLYRRQYVTSAPNVSLSNAAVTVGTSEVVLATAAAGRQELIVQNSGSQPIYVGATGVTTANGIEVSKKSTMTIGLGEALDLFAISGTAGQDVRVMQVA